MFCCLIAELHEMAQFAASASIAAATDQERRYCVTKNCPAVTRTGDSVVQVIIGVAIRKL